MNIFWFRRDLRLEDNIGLYEALKAGKVLPIFIFDINILNELPKNDARITFIYQLLKNLQKQLALHNRNLAVFYGEPEDVFKKLIQENKINAVYTNHDYEPYARNRDEVILEILTHNSIDFKTFKDQIIFEKNDVIKGDGTPYTVYTPYMKRWKEAFRKQDLISRSIKNNMNDFAIHSYPFMTLKDIGFEESEIKVLPFDVSENLIDNYEHTRDFPSIHGTSLLSPHLRFGTISIRQVIKKATESKNEILLNELIWREFFMQILWHFPFTVTKSFKPKYDTIKWRNNEVEFKAWCDGKTGYPLVDAGMRQLNATGYMHNRVRMVTAGFLCKHLLIDWRWGEAYFAEKLLDYEQASNVGNWQWAAGSGVDAAPYFRIFNPTEQTRKFDKNLEYIKKWVPEHEDLNYRPIVDHKEARERALKIYKQAVL